MIEIVSTGIPALDKLLGKGLRPKSVVLLRGGAGCGKTTLAMQIMNSIIENDKGAALYLSLETSPEDVRESMNESFKMGFNSDEAGAFTTMAAAEVRKVLEEDSADLERLKDQGNRALSVTEAFIEHLDKLIQPDKLASGKPLIIVIDSLNVLCAMISAIKAKAGEHTDLRSICLEIAQSTQNRTNGAIIIMIGEYDSEDRQSSSIFGESFFADVDIVLSQEDVGLRRDLKAFQQTPPQKRFFCRVRKARGLPSQTRRCAYDFVKGKGLVFYETYPGDGHVVLFQENLQERNEWNEIFALDIPDIYPSLSFESFGRSGLQRTFAVKRQHRSIPQRMNMYLTSMDTYWIKWYTDLCQHLDIVDVGKSILDKRPIGKRIDENNPMFSLATCRIHRECLRVIGEWRIDGRIPQVAEGKVRRFTADEQSSAIARLNVNLNEIMQTSVGNEFSRDEVSQWLFEALKNFDGTGLFAPLEWKKLRLYGKHDAEIIEELRTPIDFENRPILAPFGEVGSNHALAVPYNANVGFILVNQPQFVKSLRGLVGNSSEPMELKLSRIAKLIKDEYLLLQPRSGEEAISEEIHACIEERANHIVNEKAENYLPETWEEVFMLCRHFKDMARRQAVGLRTKESENRTLANYTFPFLLETSVFGTCFATFMEMFWSSGHAFVFNPDYSYVMGELKVGSAFSKVDPGKKLNTVDGIDIDGANGGGDLTERLLWTLRIFRNLFDEGYTPFDSSVEPNYVFKRGSQLDEEMHPKGSRDGDAGKVKSNDEADRVGDNHSNVEEKPAWKPADSWLFTRQWYTTFVDTLTATSENIKSATEEGMPGELRKREFADDEPLLSTKFLGTNLRLMPIPISMEYYNRQRLLREGGNGNASFVHHGCLGEWYFGVLKGSENMALAEDLINNLMNGQRIINRARQCAAVPTVEDFYTTYGKTQAIDLSARRDITLPTQTWNEFRDQFLRGARSRSSIFDYRHCIRELHGVLEYVRSARGVTRPNDESIRAEIVAALERIRGFALQQRLTI